MLWLEKTEPICLFVYAQDVAEAHLWVNCMGGIKSFTIVRIAISNFLLNLKKMILQPAVFITVMGRE